MYAANIRQRSLCVAAHWLILPGFPNFCPTLRELTISTHGQGGQ